VEIGNLGERISGLSGASLNAALERLAALRETIEAKGWLKQALIRTALARAYGQAERFADAIAEYEAALQSDPARLTLKDIEALANFHVRSAADAAKGDAAAAKRRIESGMGWIRWLVAGPGASVTDDSSLATQPNATSERLALMGSAYKRLWRVEPRLPHLQTMALLYRQADELARARNAGHPDLYPLVNRLYAELALSWAAPGAGAAPEAIMAGLTEARVVLAQAGESTTDPWHWIVDADCDLLQLLVEGKLDDASSGRLAEKYRNAAAISTPRQLASVGDQIEFLAAIAQTRAPDVSDRLRSLATRLSGEEAAPMVVFDEESVARAATRKRKRAATSRAGSAAGRRGGRK
jgi:tetratricopeptide (TPR) repeat protein